MSWVFPILTTTFGWVIFISISQVQLLWTTKCHCVQEKQKKNERSSSFYKSFQLSSPVHQRILSLTPHPSKQIQWDLSNYFYWVWGFCSICASKSLLKENCFITVSRQTHISWKILRSEKVATAMTLKKKKKKGWWKKL